MNGCIPEDKRNQPGECWLFGHRFHVVTPEQALGECVTVILNHAPSHFITANLDFLAQSRRRPELTRVLRNADRVFCDGMPLVWMSRFFGSSTLPARVTGSDLTPLLLAWCASNSRRVFLIWGNPESLDHLTSDLTSRIPDLQIAGVISPPFGPIDSWDNRDYINQIRAAKPDVLLVALGFPKQDEWIERYRGDLDIPLCMGVGASLDFITGRQIRAPKWLQRIGFEWLWRMLLDPRRLCRRYAYDFVVLLGLIFKELRKNRLRLQTGRRARRSEAQT